LSLGTFGSLRYRVIGDFDVIDITAELAGCGRVMVSDPNFVHGPIGETLTHVDAQPTEAIGGVSRALRRREKNVAAVIDFPSAVDADRASGSR
jgi:hypothetical protein